MFVLLLGLSLCLVSAQAQEKSCSSEPCQRNAKEGYSSERRAFARLLCYLDCLDSSDKNVSVTVQSAFNINNSACVELHERTIRKRIKYRLTQ